MSKHTPGPWVVADISNKSQFSKGWREIRVAGMGASGWIVCGDSYESTRDGTVTGCRISEANARLIAAAPELLEALQYARRFLTPADHDTAYVDAVIANATGERP